MSYPWMVIVDLPEMASTWGQQVAHVRTCWSVPTNWISDWYLDSPETELLDKGAYLGHQIRSDQISRSVVSDTLRPHESKHARPPCPSPTPGVHWDSLPSSWWCHPAISSSVAPFSSCPQSFPTSGSFPMSQLLASGGQFWDFSFSIIPSKEIPGLISFRMDWLDLLAVQGTLKSLLQHHSSKASILWCSAFFIVQLSHPYMTTDYSLD